MEIHMEEAEAALAFRILRNRLEDLRVEVRHNKNSEVKDYLKYKERILGRVLEKFKGVDEEAHKKEYKG